MAYILTGILSGLIVFAYIFVWQKPQPVTSNRFGRVETETPGMDGWIVKLLVFTALASVVWVLFWPAVGAVKLAKVIKARLDARQSA